MKTKEELMAMSKEELVDFAFNNDIYKIWYEEKSKKVKELTKILDAIGLVYENYRTDKQ